ncbi:transcription factor IBH1-like [Miscanthus floridulus]|uniref:transcription factor IBH1-like n=1 Tax=Miscanthus floridulus TaxID=154761 RepID=UPI00345782BF
MAGKRTTTARNQHQPPPSPPNPNPNRRRRASASDPAPDERPSKRMLAFHFLRALARIHSTTPAPRRPRTIRRAAYSSMARAASPRRAWTQALLRQARARRVVARSSTRAVLLRRRVSAAAPPAPPLMLRASSAGETSSAPTPAAAPAAVAARGPPPRQAGEPARADALRQLVPGGAEMEYCSLLDETADYVRCLRAQVQLMQSLVDLFSAQRSSIAQQPNQ